MFFCDTFFGTTLKITAHLTSCSSLKGINLEPVFSFTGAEGLLTAFQLPRPPREKGGGPTQG